jgi:predicted O-linked N-acetylglucosamine transferase (SPINDLY family)
VTHTLADYEALAMRLAKNPTLLAGLRERLQQARLTAPLFDIERYARNLDSAFTYMVRLYERGSPPTAFAVADLAG